jgi:hypothetical protein
MNNVEIKKFTWNHQAFKAVEREWTIDKEQRGQK